MSHFLIPGAHYLVGPDKVSYTTRIDRGVKITTQAPQSPICAAHADLLAAAGVVIQETVSLKTALDTYNAAEAAFTLARTALGATAIKWDGAYSVFTSTGERYTVTPADVASTGGAPAGKTIYPLVMPISVDFKWIPAKNVAKVHVHRAPGMSVVGVQISPDPITATSWTELDGNGAIHLIPNPAKGTMWARAQSRTAKGKSDFTTPVSVIVK